MFCVMPRSYFSKYSLYYSTNIPQIHLWLLFQNIKSIFCYGNIILLLLSLLHVPYVSNTFERFEHRSNFQMTWYQTSCFVSSRAQDPDTWKLPTFWPKKKKKWEYISCVFRYTLPLLKIFTHRNAFIFHKITSSWKLPLTFLLSRIQESPLIGRFIGVRIVIIS